VVGTRAGTGQFVPGFGELKTAQSSVSKWAARIQYVPSGHAIRLPNGFGQHFRIREAAELTSGTMTAIHVHVISRALYASAISPRAFFEMRFRFSIANGSAALAARLIEATLQLPLRVGGESGEYTLASVGPPLAHYYRRNTTMNAFGQPVPRWLVTAANPLIVLTSPVRLEGDFGIGLRSPSETKSGHAPVQAHYAKLEGVDTWVIEEADLYRRQRLELQVARLHAERSTFENLLRALIRTKPSAAYALDPEATSIQAVLLECSKYLTKEVSYGEEQSSLLRALETDLVLHESEWAVIRECLNSLPEGVGRVAVPALGNLIGEKIEIIMGDKFENITGSTILNRSKVKDAFNTLSGSAEPELELALREMVTVVEKWENPDAADLAEEFIDGVANKKSQPVLQALWSAVKSASPVVGSLAGVAGVLGKFLGVS